MEELSATDYDSQLSLIPDRAPDTCEWLSAHPSFKNWLCAIDSDLLWLRGYPGVGKTVLAKHLVTSVIPSRRVSSRILGTIQSNDPTGSTEDLLTYFFCSEQDNGRQLEYRILRSVLHQLVSLEGASIHALATFLKEIRIGFRYYAFLYDNTRLWDALKAVIISLKLQTIYLVFDALDEMDPNSLRSFASALRDLARSVGPQIQPRRLKVLVTSRPDPELDDTLDCPSIAVRSQRDVKYCVVRVVDRFSWYHAISQQLKDRIVETISEKAGNMFLWAQLALAQFTEDLTARKTVEDTLTHLDLIPPTLHSLYGNILDRMGDSKLALVMKILAWLTVSSRPLTTKELNFACNIGETTTTISAIRNSVFDEANFETFCPSLIRVDSARLVYLVHQSLADFLQSPETTQRYRLLRSETCAKVARFCLQCFMLDDFDGDAIRKRISTRASKTSQEFHDVNEECALLRYASTAWPFHADLAEDDPRVWQAFARFCERRASYASGLCYSATMIPCGPNKDGTTT